MRKRRKGRKARLVDISGRNYANVTAIKSPKVQDENKTAIPPAEVGKDLATHSQISKK